MRWAVIAAVAAAAATAPGCSRGPKVKVAKAVRARVETTITTASAGTVVADQQAALGFTAAGRVSRVAARAGDAVKKGQVLAQLENADLVTIDAEARAELSRSKELFGAGLVSQAALDEARKNAEVARANLGRTIIVAPFDGLVTEVNLEVGDLAQGGAAGAGPAIRIVDVLPRLVQGAIDELDLAKVRAGTPARVRIPALRHKPFEAEVTRVVPFVSTVREQDRTSQVELRLTTAPEGGPAAVPVGASADIEIIIEAKDQALAVPSRALLGLGESRYVYLARDGKASRTPVKTGVGNYDRMEIVEGVNEGDAVILPPDDVELKDGLKVDAQPMPWP